MMKSHIVDCETITFPFYFDKNTIWKDLIEFDKSRDIRHEDGRRLRPDELTVDLTFAMPMPVAKLRYSVDKG